MLFSKQSAFSSLGLALVIIFTSWLSIKSTQNYSTSKLPDDFPVNISHDATIMQINPDGSLKYTASTKKLTRFANDNVAMATASLILYSKNKKDKPWNITADNALVSETNNKVNLFGNVVMERDGNSNKNPPLKITTTQAYIFPKKNLAQTDKPVKMVETGTPNIITAVGLEAYFNPTNIKLLSNVRSYYDKNYDKKNQ